jgi:outer membrane immunogenic protein
MRRFSTLLITTLSIALAQAASAADLPIKTPGAPVQAPPDYWYGFFIGIQGGYGWGGNAINLTPNVNYVPTAAAGGFPLSVAGDPHGGLAGIQYGSNFQFGHIVLGTASDFSFTDIKASQTSFSTIGGPIVTTLGKQKLEWLSTTRGRVGYTMMDNLLLYGTGGLATGRGSASSSITLARCPGIGNCSAGSDAKTLWGWAAGGGLEYAVGHWSANVEYIHYDLGHLNYNMTDATFPGGFIATSTKFSGDVVRGGLNYRFDWTPWELIFGRFH